MLTRREVEGELRRLHPFRDATRERRAERERLRRFARSVLGACVGMAILAMLGAVSLLRRSPPDIAFGHVSGGRATEWVSNGPQFSERSIFDGRRHWFWGDRPSHGHRGT